MVATQTLQFYVNGKWEESKGASHPVTNPAFGEVIANVPFATAAEVDRVAKLAHAAFLKWREVPVIDRVQVLYRYKTLLEKNTEDVASAVRRRVPLACSTSWAGRPPLVVGGGRADAASASPRRPISRVSRCCIVIRWMAGRAGWLAPRRLGRPPRPRPAHAGPL